MIELCPNPWTTQDLVSMGISTKAQRHFLSDTLWALEKIERSGAERFKNLEMPHGGLRASNEEGVQSNAVTSYLGSNPDISANLSSVEERPPISPDANRASDQTGTKIRSEAGTPSISPLMDNGGQLPRQVGKTIHGSHAPAAQFTLNRETAISGDKRESSLSHYSPTHAQPEMRTGPDSIQSPENYTPFEDFDGPCGAD